MIDTADVIAILFFLVISFLCGCLAGGGCCVDAQRNQAIEAGVGRWVIDAKTGDKSFVYGPAAAPAK